MNYGKLLWRKAYVGLLIILLCACLGSILGAWCGVLLCVDGCLSAAISKAVRLILYENIPMKNASKSQKFL